MNTWKLGKLQKKYIQNLTRCKKFKSKTDAWLISWFKIWRFVKKVDSKTDKTKKIWFKIWQDEKFLIQNHAFYKNFFIQNHAF